MADVNYDFSAPFVAARIRTQDGNSYPLWVNIGGDSAQRPLLGSLQALAWVQEVNIEIGLSMLPKISINLAPPYREGKEFLDSPLIEYGTSVLDVQFGYVNSGIEKPPVVSGILWEPDFEIGAEIQFTLNAMGLGGYDMAKTEGNRVFNNVNRVYIIRELMLGAAEKKRNFNPESPEIPDSNKYPKEYGLLMKDVENYSQGGKTDWQAMWEVANQALCGILHEGDMIKIVPQSQLFDKQPSKIFRLYDFPAGEIGVNVSVQKSGEAVFPILNVSTPTRAIFLPKSLRGYIMSEVPDEDPRKDFTPTEINDDSEAPPRTAKGKAAPAETEDFPGIDPITKSGAEFIPGDPAWEEVYNHARSDWAKNAHMGIQLEIETVGIPDINPGETVMVEGVCKRIQEHRFGVLTVKHSIGLGGFSTSLSLISNTDTLTSGGFAGIAAGKEAKGKPNTQDPEPTDGKKEREPKEEEVPLGDLDSPDVLIPT